MLNLFRKLLSKEAPALPPVETPGSFEVLQGVAPLMSGDAPAATPRHSFVCRVPLLNRQEKIAGYQFSLHENVQARLHGKLDLVQKAYDDVLLRHLASLGINSLLGHRLAVIGLAPASLSNPRLSELPAENTVFLVIPTQQKLPTEELSALLQNLREAGYAHGWLLRQPDLHRHPELLGLAAVADYVQIEVNGFDGMDIKTLLKSLRSRRPDGLPPLKLVASEISTFDEFSLCFRGGFDLFHGRFVSSRENWHPPKSDINRLQVIELLNLVRSDAEFDAIAEQLKREPVLTFKLLRYLNSPAMGMQSPVDTMNQALLILGRDKFYRWLSLLLFDIKTPGFRERILTEQALTRGRCLENLAGQGRLPAQKDQLFLLGLFSLLDVLMGQPMPAMLKQAKLPEAVRAALLGEPGPYRDALTLAVALDGLEHDEIKRCADACGVDAMQISRAAIDALAWANEITALNES